MSRPREKKSLVWEFFEKETCGKIVTCKLCKNTFKYFWNTTNCMNHLKRKHPIQLADRDERTAANVTRELPASTQQNLPNSSATEQQINKKRKHQVRFYSSPMFSENESKSIDKILLDFIILDHQPLQIVENMGFIRYTQKLKPEYSLPSRKTLSEKMLPERYDLILRAMKEKIKHVQDFAITTDMWTSDSNKSYLTVTSHFISDSKLNSLVLSTTEMPQKHSAQNIASCLREILEKWQIYHKIVTFVTDNAATMKKAIVEDLSKRNHFCVAHTLNLAVHDAVDEKANPELSKLLVTCRTLIGHFKRSSAASYKLREIQIRMALPTLKLKQDVVTRWNSALLMMERLSQMKEPLSAALSSIVAIPVKIEAEQWSAIDECISILKPVEKMTIELSAENYPTLSRVIPLVRGLQHALNNKTPVTYAALELKRLLLEAIKKRLGILETNRTAAKATFLDPRFKKSAFGLDTNAVNAQQWIIDDLKRLINLPNTHEEISAVSTATTSVTNTTRMTEDDELWKLFDEKVAENITVTTSSASAIIIVRQYVEMPYLDRKEDPLKFWENRKKTFPELYSLACRYLCIPATSVPSERVFSEASLICNQRRNRLDPEKVDALIFLNSALKNIEADTA